MTTRRRALLGLAGLAWPGAALAQPLPKPPDKPKPPAKKAPARAAPPPDRKPRGKAAPTVRQPSARARPAPPPESRAETAAEAEPRPRRPMRAREDGPSLRPLDRELVHNWLAANPDWRPSGSAQPLAEGRPLPPGLPRQPLPPGLAMLLPYFPGYRYAAVGPDLVLYATATEQVASLLPGALAR